MDRIHDIEGKLIEVLYMNGKQTTGTVIKLIPAAYTILIILNGDRIVSMSNIQELRILK